MYHIFFQVSENLKTRIYDYIYNRINQQVKQFKQLIYLNTTEKPEEILQKIYNDKIDLWRYIDRIYICDRKTRDYKNILASNFTDKIIRVVAFPKELQNKLLIDLESKCVLNPKTFTDILYVVKINDEYYYGLKNKKFYYKKPTCKEATISRAYHKLKEALHIFDISPEKNWKVLDLGAAPGGWSQYLCDKVNTIIAVDPAKLEIQPKENIIHIQKKVEDAILEIQKYGKYDLVVCDINQDPKEIAVIINKLSKFLKENGVLIFTIKLIYHNPNKQKHLLTQVKNILSKNFENIKIIWLPANSLYERTLLAIKKSNPN